MKGWGWVNVSSSPSVTGEPQDTRFQANVLEPFDNMGSCSWKRSVNHTWINHPRSSPILYRQSRMWVLTDTSLWTDALSPRACVLSKQVTWADMSHNTIWGEARHGIFISKALVNVESSRVKVSTWPFTQPPMIIFGLDGQNWKTRMSSGHSSSSCNTKRAEILRFKAEMSMY